MSANQNKGRNTAGQSESPSPSVTLLDHAKLHPHTLKMRVGWCLGVLLLLRSQDRTDLSPNQYSPFVKTGDFVGLLRLNRRGVIQYALQHSVHPDRR